MDGGIQWEASNGAGWLLRRGARGSAGKEGSSCLEALTPSGKKHLAECLCLQAARGDPQTPTLPLPHSPAVLPSSEACNLNAYQGS